MTQYEVVSELPNIIFSIPSVFHLKSSKINIENEDSTFFLKQPIYVTVS